MLKTLIDSSAHHLPRSADPTLPRSHGARDLGCGWSALRTRDDFAQCPDCGGEVANCWVGDAGVKTWACVAT